MEFQQVVDRRRMVRNYDPDRPVPRAVVDRMMRNALHAPSAGFSQGWAFLVLTEDADRQRFWRAASDPSDSADRWLTALRRAPVLIVCLSHKDGYLDRYAEPDKGWTDRDEKRWAAAYWDIDTGMAALLILQTAVDEGLGALFFGVPPDHIATVRDEFGVPAGFHPIGVISAGYPAADRRSPSLKRGRRGADQVVHHGRWGGTEPGSVG